MEAFTAGTLAGAGSFRCDSCGFAIALHELDHVPSCPNCDGHRFRRSSMFDAGIEREAPEVDGAPEWLDGARNALVAEGDYLAFEDVDRVKVTPLQDGWTRVGRSLSAHVRFDDPTVSRRHALIYRDDSGARILDDRSLNGVFRNGERVELHELEDGDEIAIGRFRLYFVTLSDEGSREPEGVGSAVG
jgi:FHA domain-containing protein/zinc ribbon family protein